MKSNVVTFLLCVACIGCGSDQTGDGVAGASQGGGVGSGGAIGSGGTGEAGETGSGGTGQAGETGSGGTGQAGETGAGGSGGSGVATYECMGPGARFATGVTEFEFGSGQTHGQDTFPAPVLGPPAGGGCCMGALEVTSLGDGGFVVLEFAGNVIVDGPGADFIVFENPFLVDMEDPSTVFAEIGVISVSQDGDNWMTYSCEADAYPFEGCAGWHPVLYNAATNPVDPHDPAVAGGDAFDLADVGLAFARYVRIEDRTVPDDFMATFDLDAVAVVNGGCP